MQRRDPAVVASFFAAAAPMGGSLSRRRGKRGGGSMPLLPLLLAVLLLLTQQSSDAFSLGSFRPSRSMTSPTRLHSTTTSTTTTSPPPPTATTSASSTIPPQSDSTTNPNTYTSSSRRPKKTDYYAILGLEPSATPEDIKNAFRQRARETHPDASRTTDSTADFLLAKEAYETLYSAQKRAEFDRRRQMAEIVELGFNVGQILTMDVAVPLARDVAIPLIKTAFQGLDETVIKNMAGPLLKKTLEQSAAAIENIRKTAEDRANYFTQMQAEWRAQEIKSLSQQLEDMTTRAKRVQEQAKGAADVLSASIDVETMARNKLEAQGKISETLNTRTQALQEESALVLTAFRARVAEEELCRHSVKKLKTEQTRVAISSKRLETFVSSTQSELAEAEEFLRKAQLRMAKAQEAHSKAQEQLQGSLLEAAAIDQELVVSNEALIGASAAVVPQKLAWESVQDKEKQLSSEIVRHNKQEATLRFELMNAGRKREASQREFERLHKDTNTLQRNIVELAAAIEKKYNEVQSGSGITSASTATVNEEKRKKAAQKSSFEGVFGRSGVKNKNANVQQQAAAAAATTTATTTETRPKKGAVPDGAAATAAATAATAAKAVAAAAAAEREMKRKEENLDKEIAERDARLESLQGMGV